MLPKPQVLHAFGVPTKDSSLRDPDRSLRHAVDAVARLVEGELADKLEQVYSVTCPRAPSDLAILANAAAKLAAVPEDARKLVGL